MKNILAGILVSCLFVSVAQAQDVYETLSDFKAGIKADTIAESTAATGITADSVLLKDGGVTATGTVNVSALAINSDVTDVIGANYGAIAVRDFVNANAPLTIVSPGANADGAYVVGMKTRAVTTDANTVVQSGDSLLVLQAYGADGAAYARAGNIQFKVDATPGSGDMPGNIIFNVTPDGSATPAQAMKIGNDKAVTLAGTLTSTATGSLGMSIVLGANAACTETCTSACVHGWETTAGEVAVDCADATADKCLCAGAS